MSTERPSTASRAMIERLIGFNTVSRDSNLGLIEWVRDYLRGFGAVTRLTYDATGKKANLFATLGDSKKPGLILSGHTDVVPVDGQDWGTDPFAAVESEGKLFRSESQFIRDSRRFEETGFDPLRPHRRRAGRRPGLGHRPLRGRRKRRKAVPI